MGTPKKPVNKKVDSKDTGEDEDDDGQAMGEGNCGDTGQADTLADNGSGACADEHKCEGANQLRKELGCKWIEQTDLLR